MTALQLLVVVLAGLLTYAIRASFLVVAGRMTTLPPLVTTILRMIPAAALAALVLPSLLRPGAGALDPVNSILAGGIVTVLVARWRGSMGLSLAAGLVVVMATRPFLG